MALLAAFLNTCQREVLAALQAGTVLVPHPCVLLPSASSSAACDHCQAGPSPVSNADL